MMKRKRHVEEPSDSHNNVPDLRRARSREFVNLDEEDIDRTKQVESAPVDRRVSRRGTSTEENEEDAALLEDSSEDNEGEDNENEDRNETFSEPSAYGVEECPELEENTRRKNFNGYLSNSAKKAQMSGIAPVKGPMGRIPFSTPVKTNAINFDTPKIERHVDRSARRRSTRNLIERTLLGNISDNDDGEEDIEDDIYGSGGEAGDGDAVQDEPEVNEEALVNDPETPSKTAGRRKTSKNKKPSPPPSDLPPHELYFSQNRGARSRTSNNNLSSLQLLDHEEYFTLLRKFKDPHQDDIEWLQEVHSASFNQWQFELSQNFNICLFGWGSKRSLLMKFAEHIYKSQQDHSRDKIVVVNGYVQALTIRDVLNTVAAAVSDPPPKLGSQPADMLENLLNLLGKDTSRHITVIIHSIDRAPLRRPLTQIILSRLSSHPLIHIVASADHPSFPLLWDSSLRSMYNFLFHDCTTFQPYSSEIDVVDEVHELFGRSGRRVGGKEGVSFVLKSLPENAKNLFRVLIGEQLAAMDGSSGANFGNDDEDDEIETQPGTRGSGQGVEYRVLYQKAVEEFICSNEMNFRTLLKE
jgi:origin recognition complex subunit 2